MQAYQKRSWWLIGVFLGALGLIGLMIGLIFNQPDPPTSELALDSTTTTQLPENSTPASQQPTNEAHLYALIRQEEIGQQQLVRIENGNPVLIATVDLDSEKSTLILPAQQTLLIQRGLQILAIDMLGMQRWAYTLQPDAPIGSPAMLALDAPQTGVYILAFDVGIDAWQLSHLRLVDGHAIEPTVELKLPQVDWLPLLTKTGQVWFIDNQQLYRADPSTKKHQSFGRAVSAIILGDGQADTLGVIRSKSTVALINEVTNTERLITLAEPIEGDVINAILSQDKLLINSLPTNSQSANGAVTRQKVYALSDGSLQATLPGEGLVGLAAGSKPDQWLMFTLDGLQFTATIERWDVNSNLRGQLLDPMPMFKSIPTWAREVVGEPIMPLNQPFLDPIAPRPTQVVEVPPTVSATLIPAEPQPIGLFSKPDTGFMSIQQLTSDQQIMPIAEKTLAVFERYNQAPLLLQRPEFKTWQLFDPMTEQTVQWEFEQTVVANSRSLQTLLNPNQQRLLMIVGRDVRSSDQFKGADQLVVVNTQTGAWDVVADSQFWPELKLVTPLAWHDDTVYFLQNNRTSWKIWTVNLGMPLSVTPFAEIPALLGKDPISQQPYYARVFISPNQRWLSYSLASSNGQMLLRVVDLVNQASHDLELPLFKLNSLSFSPEGNRFAVMRFEPSESSFAPALYDLEQRRWEQLYSGNYTNYYDPFVWSPDGRWLAIGFNLISSQDQVAVYDTTTAQLLFNTDSPAKAKPLALFNDGKTMIFWQAQLMRAEQLTWDEPRWQTEWRMDMYDVALFAETLHYVYPR